MPGAKLTDDVDDRARASWPRHLPIDHLDDHRDRVTVHVVARATFNGGDECGPTPPPTLTPTPAPDARPRRCAAPP